MKYVGLTSAYVRELMRVMSSDLSTYHKILWLKTRYKALLCRVMKVAVHNKSLHGKLHHRELWYRGIIKEVMWWEQWIATEEGVTWKKELQDPRRLIQDHIVAEQIQDLSSNPISILDVGAGPITSLGYVYPGKALKITAIDPLAHEYNRILKHAQINPPIRTLSCHGERLLKKFPAGSFDVAYASNSLDHSYNPLYIIRNMLALVKKDRFVLLRHYRNEGRTGKYHGLHQWNFDINQSDFIIWNEAQEYNVTQMLRGKVAIDCYYETSTSHGVFDHSDWVVCIMKKLNGN